MALLSLRSENLSSSNCTTICFTVGSWDRSEPIFVYSNFSKIQPRMLEHAGAKLFFG